MTEEDIQHLQNYITMRMNTVSQLKGLHSENEDYYKGELMAFQELAQILDEKARGEK